MKPMTPCLLMEPLIQVLGVLQPESKGYPLKHVGASLQQQHVASVVHSAEKDWLKMASSVGDPVPCQQTEKVTRDQTRAANTSQISDRLG